MDAPTHAQKLAAMAPKCPTSAWGPDGRTVQDINGPEAPDAPKTILSKPVKIRKEMGKD